jgi:hypothetical protein
MGRDGYPAAESAGRGAGWAITADAAHASMKAANRFMRSFSSFFMGGDTKLQSVAEVSGKCCKGSRGKSAYHYQNA